MKDTQLAEHSALYLEAILDGERNGAIAAVQRARSEGCRLVDLFEDVIRPAQVEVGERWHRGELSVADEHRATELTMVVIDWLRSVSQPRCRVGVTAIVSAVERERHVVGARMFAELLYLDGWAVTYLGADTPAQATVDFSHYSAPDLLVLSVTQKEHAETLRATIEGIRAQPGSPKVLVGGSAVSDLNPDHFDGVASTLREGLGLARRLVGMDRSERVLETFLRDLGGQIQALRRERGWSQQQLANRAGLDRTYISAVEHGKQNVTLGAIAKIAQAFGLVLHDLLSDGAPPV